jgi:LemA protein
MVLWLWFAIGVVLLIAVIFFSYFNRFAILGNRIDNSLGQINVQLKRRSDLIPNLMETVKGYAKHERKIMKEVTDAHKAMVSAKDLTGKVKASDVLQNSLGRLFAIAENYPKLQANENFMELQKELSTTEDRIAYARQFYNDSILSYNNLCKTFPGVMFAGIYGKKPKEFLQIAEAEKKVVKVKFD